MKITYIKEYGIFLLFYTIDFPYIFGNIPYISTIKPNLRQNNYKTLGILI